MKFVSVLGKRLSYTFNKDNEFEYYASMDNILNGGDVNTAINIFRDRGIDNIYKIPLDTFVNVVDMDFINFLKGRVPDLVVSEGVETYIKNMNSLSDYPSNLFAMIDVQIVQEDMVKIETIYVYDKEDLDLLSLDLEHYFNSGVVGRRSSTLKKYPFLEEILSGKYGEPVSFEIYHLLDRFPFQTRSDSVVWDILNGDEE